VQAAAIEASFEDGLLTVRVPKAEEAKPRRINVQVGGASQPAVQGSSTEK
jgi:Hsp20/alpha crystallin family